MFMFAKLKSFIPLAIIITAFCGLVYVAVHQTLRQSANDPQIQMSEDSAASLQNGAKAEDLIGKISVDPSKSLSPFLIIFNDAGQPVNSQAAIEGRIPTPPSGVFDEVRSRGENHFTWEPRPGVRIAAVVNKFEGANPGFVLAGRSIREVEQREDLLTKETAAVWLAALLLTFFATIIFK